jgi:GcrA cell cycle regulator
MLWTEEAVEVLKTLALEGRSASAIAAALGAASRNAVIGKASRIGIRLNGDGRASIGRGTQASAHGPQTATFGRPTLRLKSAPGKLTSAPALSRRLKRISAWSFADAEVGEMRRVAFEDMQGLACRWPLGDPTSADFTYCGLKSADGRPYCPGHCRMAYKPPTALDKRRLSGSSPCASSVRECLR